MIVKTLERTKSATYVVLTPSPDPILMGLPTPRGTGFFVSSDGYFVTARHVIEHKTTKAAENTNKPLYTSADLGLTKPELHGPVTGVTIVKDWPVYDLALLKVDFDKNKEKEAFKAKRGFDFLSVDFNIVSEGTSVYAFGYPLSDWEASITQDRILGFHFFSPRTTSAIIASHYDVMKPVRTSGDPKYYVIDKALNYGNSAGPIVVEETGKAISVCIRFQPVGIPQHRVTVIEIPSLYGVTSSLQNIEQDLKQALKL